MADDDKKLPLHDEAQARQRWRGDDEKDEATAADGEADPEPSLGLELRPPD